jgi:hypothetical protein
MWKSSTSQNKSNGPGVEHQHPFGKSPVTQGPNDATKTINSAVKDGYTSAAKEVVPMVIDCKHVWNYISEYLDGTLSDEIRETVQKHLEHCEICSAILDSTRNIIILTADDRVFELPAGFSERLHARLDKELPEN